MNSPPIRLLSWNVWKMLGDPLAVYRILRAAEPDLVCLQEAPARVWSGRRLAALGRSSGLRVVTGGRSAAGNALLCSARLQVRDPLAVTFRPQSWWIERRGAVLATVRRPGGPSLRVAGVHLGLQADERLDHLAELTGRLAAAGLPVVVAGDLNEPPGGPVWQALSAIVNDPVAGTGPGSAPTYPARAPRVRIDAVLTGPQVETLEYGRWCPDLREARLASDHLPVLALLRPRAGSVQPTPT